MNKVWHLHEKGLETAMEYQLARKRNWKARAFGRYSSFVSLRTTFQVKRVIVLAQNSDFSISFPLTYHYVLADSSHFSGRWGTFCPIYLCIYFNFSDFSFIIKINYVLKLFRHVSIISFFLILQPMQTLT